MSLHSHHTRIYYILSCLRDDFFADNGILFCGGTMLTLTHGEYRRADDIDFAPNPAQGGYRLLRNLIRSDASVLFKKLPPDITLSEARYNQYGIKFEVQTGDASDLANIPITFEIFLESRLAAPGKPAFYPNIPVPCLNDNDQAVQKLLVNTDQGADTALDNRDVYDLAILATTGQCDMKQAIVTANKTYDVEKSLDYALSRTEDIALRTANFRNLAIEPTFWGRLEDGMDCLRAHRGMMPLPLRIGNDISA
ncbi:MAG: nucleotidyl transferase AbiEii/AbiGii toxin family protein [Pseudomonadota bacterium]